MCGRNAIIGDGSLALWLALAWLLPVALGAAAGSVPQSEREIPVVRQADVLVVGGTLGAVAAAVEAAEGGARVFLAAPRPYLGEASLPRSASARRAPRRVDEGICGRSDHPDACETDPGGGARLVRGGLLAELLSD